MDTVARRCVSPELAKDFADTLARLTIARVVDDRDEIRVQEERLNWLIDRVSSQRLKNPNQSV